MKQPPPLKLKVKLKVKRIDETGRDARRERADVRERRRRRTSEQVWQPCVGPRKESS